VTEGSDLEVLVDTGSFPASATELASAARATLLAEGCHAAEISVTLLGDDEMRRLNREFLGKDAVTDVLAFSLGDRDLPVGDVYVGFEQGCRQARELGVAEGEELIRLVVHGTLHALGYDHPEGPEREQSSMFARQEELVRGVLSDLTGA
jgi:probable rRNA maturation factor